MTVELAALTRYLDDYLRIREIPDFDGALNGLQVQNDGSVHKVLAAVDACQASIEAAVATGSDLLLVHHGLFWRGTGAVIGRHWRRLRTLLTHGVAVYSAHLPLDCHGEVGNNAVLARALGLEDLEPFGEFKHVAIGFAGSLHLPLAQFVNRVRDTVGADPRVLAGGPSETQRVGVITGGGGSMIEDARGAGLDTFVTGEGSHHSHFDAIEGGINVLLAGHYATETFGVCALAEHINERFGLPWEFHNNPTGL